MIDSRDPVRLEEILEILGDAVTRVVGPTDRTVTHPAPMQEADSELAITFSESGDSRLRQISSSKAGVVICPHEKGIAALAGDKTLILVGDPRLSFIKLMQVLFAEPRPTGIHPTAVVNPAARVHPDVYVGPFVNIGVCEIGEGTLIHGNVSIHSNTRIGSNVVIHAGAAIGSSGFNYYRNGAGDIEFFPHIGGVVVGDDVEIGANACIDRGILSDTVISEGTKIDNLVQVGHTVRIGRRCLIANGVLINGNVVIGDDVWIGPGALISNNIRINDGANVSLGAVVATDVEQSQKVTGYFAVEHSKFLRSWYDTARGGRSA